MSNKRENDAGIVPECPNIFYLFADSEVQKNTVFLIKIYISFYLLINADILLINGFRFSNYQREISCEQ